MSWHAAPATSALPLRTTAWLWKTEQFGFADLLRVWYSAQFEDYPLLCSPPQPPHPACCPAAWTERLPWSEPQRVVVRIHGKDGNTPNAHRDKRTAAGGRERLSSLMLLLPQSWKHSSASDRSHERYMRRGEPVPARAGLARLSMHHIKTATQRKTSCPHDRSNSKLQLQYFTQAD